MYTIETLAQEIRTNERTEIVLTAQELHGEELSTFTHSLFGEATAYANDSTWGEKVWVQVARALGYSFKTSYKTRKVESGEKNGVSLGYSAARIANTLDAVTAWVESSKAGTVLVIKFTARQVAEEVLEEVTTFFVGALATQEAPEVSTEAPEAQEEENTQETAQDAPEGSQEAQKSEWSAEGFARLREALGAPQAVKTSSQSSLFFAGEELWEACEVLTAHGKVIELASFLERVYGQGGLEEAEDFAAARKELREWEAEINWKSEPRTILTELDGTPYALEYFEVEIQTSRGIICGFGIEVSDSEPLEFIGTYGGILRYAREVIGATL